MDQDATWDPGGIVLDGDPAPPRGKGHNSPHFSAHFVLARSPISATAELLLLRLQADKITMCLWPELGLDIHTM